MAPVAMAVTMVVATMVDAATRVPVKAMAHLAVKSPVTSATTAASLSIGPMSAGRRNVIRRPMRRKWRRMRNPLC
jgi:hypothetical protein